MTKLAYGIPVPRGVPKDWEPNSMTLDSAGIALRSKLVPESWRDPIKCVAWFDRFGRARLIVGHYANGREALVRIDANRNFKTTFGQVPASAAGARSGETRQGLDPKDGRAAREAGDAQAVSQTPPEDSVQ